MAAQIAEGNQTVIEYLNNVLTSENNANRLNQMCIRDRKEIPYLKQQGYYNTAVNRLYYACYYAAVALLIKHEINPGTHAAVSYTHLVLEPSDADVRNLDPFLSGHVGHNVRVAFRLYPEREIGRAHV